MNVLTRFLKCLAVTLLGGIVGPLFIAIYFINGRDAEMGWLLYAGVGITIALVVVAFLIALAQTRSAERRKRLQEFGVLALAEVLSVSETGVSVNDQSVLKLSLRIHGDGIAPFQVDTPARVSMLEMATLGTRRLVVLVEPGTQNFEVDWERSALLSGQVPATFTSSADGHTYDLRGQAEPLLEIMKVLKQHGIDTDGVVDLRSNPAARQQVDAILRRYATMAETPEPPKSSVADRLTELDRLKASALITETEYAAKRAEILADL